MKIYIAGKITGDKHYKRKFRKAERILKRKGHSVMSPAVMNDYPEFKWFDYMQVCYSMQKICSATLLLPDWRDSIGAMKEYEHAKKLSQAIFFDIKDVPKGGKKNG